MVSLVNNDDVGKYVAGYVLTEPKFRQCTKYYLKIQMTADKTSFTVVASKFSATKFVSEQAAISAIRYHLTTVAALAEGTREMFIEEAQWLSKKITLIQEADKVKEPLTDAEVKLVDTGEVLVLSRNQVRRRRSKLRRKQNRKRTNPNERVMYYQAGFRETTPDAVTGLRKARFLYSIMANGKPAWLPYGNRRNAKLFKTKAEALTALKSVMSGRLYMGEEPFLVTLRERVDMLGLDLNKREEQPTNGDSKTSTQPEAGPDTSTPTPTSILS